MSKNNVLRNIIYRIQNDENLEEIINFCERDIFINGPINSYVLEILSVIKELQPSFFNKYESTIIRLMGLFFKENYSDVTDLMQLVMEDYKMSIEQNRKEIFTPMQNEILFKINNFNNYSFSSPTSTGKSYIFKYLIKNSQKDIMIVVPSRALINEFYIEVSSYIESKDTLVLTFVDDINKKYTKRHIFILTPERARDIFKYKNSFDFEYFLFDEAQLTDEKGERGIYYDGIVRRLKENYTKTSFLFAHPFVKNPEAQFIKNNFDLRDNSYDSFKYKNTGQLFISEENGRFYIFGTNKDIMGVNKIEIGYDPIEKVLSSDKGCVFVYTAKSRIIRREIFDKFKLYIQKYCNIQNSEKIDEIINMIRPLIGAEENESLFVENLKRGIVCHHGSMPLDVRILLEEYIKEGYCKICFATSTLAQGINMPFDLIYIDRFQNKEELLVRNIIGRAGRSTKLNKFDYGVVVVRNNNMSNIRKIINYEESLNEFSLLDIDDLDEEYKDYRDAIKNNDFSDEYNLPNKIINRVDKDQNIETIVKNIRNKIYNVKAYTKEISEYLLELYNVIVLPSRMLTDYEKRIILEANKIMLWRYQGIKFSNICKIYYNFAKKSSDKYNHGFVLKYGEVPNKNQEKVFPLFYDQDEIDYDLIVYNTYDFLDKLIDLKLSDVYYMAFMKYYEKYKDEDVKEIAQKIKYGTSNQKEIFELRYGFSSDDFEWLNLVVDAIDENEIVFNHLIDDLDEFKKKKIEKYIYK